MNKSRRMQTAQLTLCILFGITAMTGVVGSAVADAADRTAGTTCAGSTGASVRLGGGSCGYGDVDDANANYSSAFGYYNTAGGTGAAPQDRPHHREHLANQRCRDGRQQPLGRQLQPRRSAESGAAGAVGYSASYTGFDKFTRNEQRGGQIDTATGGVPAALLATRTAPRPPTAMRSPATTPYRVSVLRDPALGDGNTADRVSAEQRVRLQEHRWQQLLQLCQEDDLRLDRRATAPIGANNPAVGYVSAPPSAHGNTAGRRLVLHRGYAEFSSRRRQRSAPTISLPAANSRRARLRATPRKRKMAAVPRWV